MTKPVSKNAYAVNGQDAIDYGVEEALLLNTIRQWLHYNETDNKNIFDGYVWTYGTGEYYTKYLPFWNARKISRLFKSLVNKGVIIEGNYNKFGYDRTKWYTLPIEGKIDKSSTDVENTHLPNLANGITKSGKCHLQNLVNGITKSGEPIPTNKTINKTTNKQIKNNVSKETKCEKFEQFWKELRDVYKIYSFNIGSKQEALKQFKSLKADDSLLKTIITRTTEHLRRKRDIIDSGNFAPNPKQLCRWIKNRCWEDELDLIPVNNQSTNHTPAKNYNQQFEYDHSANNDQPAVCNIRDLI